MDDTIQNNTTRNRLQITLIATTAVASHQYTVNFSDNVSNVRYNARESKLRLDKPRVKPYFTRLFCISLPPSLPRHRAAMSTSRQCPPAASHPPHHPLCCGTAAQHQAVYRLPCQSTPGTKQCRRGRRCSEPDDVIGHGQRGQHAQTSSAGPPLSCLSSIPLVKPLPNQVVNQVMPSSISHLLNYPRCRDAA